MPEKHVFRASISDYVLSRIILFSVIAVSASLAFMHTNLLPVLVVLSLGVMPPIFGQPESVLQLEHPTHGDAPFHKGDQLDIQVDATVFPGVTRITVLDITHWPWVLAKSEQGETWLNFDHVVIARNVATVK